MRAGAIGNGNDNPEIYQYYYHSDHLGSTSLITDLDGDIVQHVEYVPFGEVFIEERNNKWNTPYLFNAKELDEETGLYYYGARYYDPRVSVWLSADPLQEKYPNISSYAYCLNNPVILIDPNGQRPTPLEAALIAKHVYGESVRLKGGWKINGKIITGENGLQYAVYDRKLKGGKMDYVLAFAGTNDREDVKQDVQQNLGIGGTQYGKAQKLGVLFDYEYNDGGDRTIVGHSLGGGLAAVASMETGIEAITFNPAAVDKKTKVFLELENANTDQIINYVVKGDIVTDIQAKQGKVADGYMIKIFNDNSEKNGSFSKKNHSIDTVIDILEK